MRIVSAPPGIVRCPSCGTGAAAEAWRPGEAVRCSGCRTRLRVTVFPELEAAVSTRGSELAVSGDAECFFHAGRKAECVCERCGRFLCTVCDLPVGARHLCPSCVESGLTASERVPELVTRRVNWGRLALSFALLPPLLSCVVFFIAFLLPITACVAIGCACYGWSKPGSLVTGRARASAVAAILVGLAELAGAGAFGYFLWQQNAHG